MKATCADKCERVSAYREQGAIKNHPAHMCLHPSAVLPPKRGQARDADIGDSGEFTCPNGVSVAISTIAMYVLVLRPIGHWESPSLSLASIRKGELGVPEEGLYYFYIASCPYRPTHLVKQMEAIDGCIHIVMIDIRIEVASTIRCKTGSVALNLSGT